MERALNIDNLADALGDQPQDTQWPAGGDGDEAEDGDDGSQVDESDMVDPPPEVLLPTPRELQRLLGDTEANLFFHRRNLPKRLLRTAWYLHGVASADAAASLYTPERQRRAFAVSAHIFDLAVGSDDREPAEALTLGFAAQVGYQRSDGEPNAMAVGRRLRRPISAVVDADDLADALPSMAVAAGAALLCQDTRYMTTVLRSFRDRLSSLATQINVSDLTATVFGPTWCVVTAADQLRRYLTGGDRTLLNGVGALLDQAVVAPAGRADRDARWVAAHLRFLAGEMSDGSVWSLIPPTIPDAARQAFTIASPPVLTLWKPQRELLAPVTPNPLQPESERPTAPLNVLDSSVRRVVLSVPTSSGKTLLSQLMMVCHLATEESGVCYVSPLRSLGREVRRTLAGRLRILAREIGRDEPDFGLPLDSELVNRILAAEDLDALFLAAEQHQGPDIAIMTPERLAHELRNDAQGVLDRFGLFVFDEAHMIRDGSRGLTLESILAFLHWRTRDTAHRIVLLSAAMGNAGQLPAWLNVDGNPILKESQWRGPRRLSAIFTTVVDRTHKRTEDVPRASRGMAQLTKRQIYPTHGLIRIKPTDRPASRSRTNQPIGQTSYRSRPDGSGEQVEKGAPHSTQLYKMLAWVVNYVGEAGPVLVIRSTRDDAKRMATAIAELIKEDFAPARPVVELARIRLGAEHPLTALLARGVAYHHAGLPVEVQEAIEDGVRAERLRYIVSTSTLTEGVNLPVRTVVLANIEYDGQPDDQQLRGARLVNAMGRAGRATKETEGWVVLARAAKPLDSDFQILNPTPDELEVNSTLGGDDVLDAVAFFEEALLRSEDAIVISDELRRSAGEHGGGEAVFADFVSYIWMVLAAEEQLGRVAEAADPVSAFTATLAYQQLDTATRQRYIRVVEAVAISYNRTDPDRRRRWALTGTTVGSAELLDDLARRVAAAIAGVPPDQAIRLRDATTAIEFLADQAVFEELLTLPEKPSDWSFHQKDSAKSPPVKVSPSALLLQWISGVGLPEIADDLFAAIPDRTFRLETTVDTVTDFCEHYFAWLLGALVRQINQHLTATATADTPPPGAPAPEAQPPPALCPELSMYVRYGVTGAAAIELVMSGVRSRELAAQVHRASVAEEVAPGELRNWLGRMTFTSWAERFDTTASGMLDLVEFARTRNAGVLRRLLGDGAARMRLGDGQLLPNIDDSSDVDGLAVTLRETEATGSPSPIGIFARIEPAELLATIPTSLHAEVQAILDTGFELSPVLADGILTVHLVDDSG